MNKKRLIGVITVKQGWAVQSFAYGRYLPLGHPDTLVENLDRWGVDEILVQCIDRSRDALGPDFALLERLGKLGIATPLIYAGGIRHADDACRVVQTAADRVCIDALLHDDLDAADAIARSLGAQALIAALPLSCKGDELRWFDYRTRTHKTLPSSLLTRLADGRISESLIIDHMHEGQAAAFDDRILQAFPVQGHALIAFGGLSDTAQIRTVLTRAQVAAVAIGNFLNYREHAVQHYKQQLADAPIRHARFAHE